MVVVTKNTRGGFCWVVPKQLIKPNRPGGSNYGNLPGLFGSGAGVDGMYAPTKIASIITAFEKANADPMMIAKQEGFKDHKEMAEYMAKRGYEWNAYKGNYVKIIGKVECVWYYNSEPKTRSVITNKWATCDTE